jgi:hypothetical protein
MIDETIWHKYDAVMPRKLVTGKWSMPIGQMWRRKVNGRWEYQQDFEPLDEFADRAW